MANCSKFDQISFIFSEYDFVGPLPRQHNVGTSLVNVNVNKDPLIHCLRILEIDLYGK